MFCSLSINPLYSILQQFTMIDNWKGTKCQPKHNGIAMETEQGEIDRKGCVKLVNSWILNKRVRLIVYSENYVDISTVYNVLLASKCDVVWRLFLYQSCTRILANIN